MEKIAIFIDGGYIEKVLQLEFGGWHIQYEDFSNLIAHRIDKNAEILRTYFYHCLPYKGNPPTQEESDRYSQRERFFNALRGKPRFEVRLGRLQKRGPNVNGEFIFEQKMVDALLSIDLVNLGAKNKIQHAAIIGGDGDFVPAIRTSKEDGIIIWLFHGKTRHNDLWKMADERVELTKSFLKSCKR